MRAEDIEEARELCGRRLELIRAKSIVEERWTDETYVRTDSFGTGCKGEVVSVKICKNEILSAVRRELKKSERRLGALGVEV
jgi:hypothetical protein